MTPEELELSRVRDRIRGTVLGSFSRLPFATLGSWCVRLPGMHPHAPKRNAIVGMIYLYGVSVLLSVISV